MFSIQILGLDEDINKLNIIHVAGTKGKVLFSQFVIFLFIYFIYDQFVDKSIQTILFFASRFKNKLLLLLGTLYISFK